MHLHVRRRACALAPLLSEQQLHRNPCSATMHSAIARRLQAPYINASAYAAPAASIAVASSFVQRQCCSNRRLTPPPRPPAAQDLCPDTLIGAMQRANFHFSDAKVVEVFSDVALGVAHMHRQQPPMAHR